MPTELLINLSTDELVSLVMNSPVMEYAYQGGEFVYVEDNMKITAETYNGLAELLGRNDLYDSIWEYYKNIEVPVVKALPDEELMESTEYDDDFYTRMYVDHSFIASINSCEYFLVTGIKCGSYDMQMR